MCLCVRHARTTTENFVSQMNDMLSLDDKHEGIVNGDFPRVLFSLF